MRGSAPLLYGAASLRSRVSIVPYFFLSSPSRFLRLLSSIMEGRRVWRAVAALLVILLVVVGPAAAEPSVCPRVSAGESILGRPDSCSALDSPVLGGDMIGVVEGDEAILQRALNLVYKKREDYVAVLFYASWCPFSKICQPNFQVLSSLFPTIRHFAFEESVIRPSILSRYGVHGFPTLFLLNSTMRVRYHGSRTINSLVAFYNDVTGANPAFLDPMPVEKIVDLSNDTALKEDNEQENCPFSWARSPEKLLQQDTYLVLAISFVLIRMLCILLPKLNACAKQAWRRHVQYASLMSLQDRSQAYVDHVRQGFNRLNPCKRGNLQEGAMNARAWASKSLASVSIGERSSGRAYSGGDRR